MNTDSRSKTSQGAIFFPLLLVAIGSYTVGECLGYGVGSILKPGAGFWPVLMGNLLIICGALLLIKAIRGSTHADRQISRNQHLAISVITVTFLVWGVLGEYLGWLFSTVLLAFTIAKIFGYKGFIQPICQSVLITAVCYLLFGLLFIVDLPPAFPEFLLK